MLRIAIHEAKGSFSDRWIDYCIKNDFQYKVVSCFDNNIMQDLKNCTHFLWHFHHARIKDMLFAKQLIYSIEMRGIKVFPNFNTVWHFDDKLGQKYLLESIGAPMVNSYVFYDKEEALNWSKNCTYPIVFKLRGGAGSENVKLVKSKNEAYRLIKLMFSKGLSNRPSNTRMKENWNKFIISKKLLDLKETTAGLKNFLLPTKVHQLNNVTEKGYFYVQEFLPNNKFDIRIIVVGKRAFGLKRIVRENDFRASGSGLIIYRKEEIDLRCVKIAFDISKKLRSQSLAYDFIYNDSNEPMIIEISYGFSIEAYDICKGFWDDDLIWNLGQFNPQYWMVEDLVSM